MTKVKSRKQKPRKQNLDKQYAKKVQKDKQADYDKKMAAVEKKKQEFLSKRFNILIDLFTFSVFNFVYSKRERGVGFQLGVFDLSHTFLKLPWGGYQLEKYHLFNFYTSRDNVGFELFFVSFGYNFAHKKWLFSKFTKGKL